MASQDTGDGNSVNPMEDELFLENAPSDQAYMNRVNLMLEDNGRRWELYIWRIVGSLVDEVINGAGGVSSLRYETFRPLVVGGADGTGKNDHLGFYKNLHAELQAPKEKLDKDKRETLRRTARKVGRDAQRNAKNQNMPINWSHVRDAYRANNCNGRPSVDTNLYPPVCTD